MVGTWFGPISLFNPIKQTSQIISGMVVFSYILKTELRPDKEVSHGVFRVSHEKATYVFVRDYIFFCMKLSSFSLQLFQSIPIPQFRPQ